MSHSGCNARDAWAAFNGLYHRVSKAALPANRPPLTRRDQIRARKQLKKQIHDDWERIKADHRDDHVGLKLDLGHAIRMITAAGRLVERAVREIDRVASDSAEIYEDLISAEVAVRHQEEDADDIGMTYRRDTFQRSSQPAPPPGGRKWFNHIANGPLSCVGLCVSGDQHNQIVDRFIMKDMWFTYHRNLWTDLHFWYGDPRDPTSKVPYEVHIMEHLAATGQENVLRMRAWHMVPEKLMYRIFLEYCPNGELSSLLNHHWALNMTNQQPDSYIPEPAIWHIFNSLIKAGLAMERVFAEVVHLDIKPDNVFLGDYAGIDPELFPDNFAMYPTCKLGDFGLATYCRLAENRHKLSNNNYIDRGTPCFIAPEQMPQYHGKSRPHLNAKTNVWGVGITVMALMNLNVHAGHLQFLQAATDESLPALVPAFTPAAIAEYSPELRKMVQACVQYGQDDRPTFSSLLASLRHHTGLAPGYRDRALGARFGTKDALPAGLTLLDGLPANVYALGMAMPL
ncbi:hypothetical protein MBLNU13_g03239t3 [Cladosporium sp. NU13]